MFEIGVDIGGTNIKIGLVDEALEIVARDSIPFPKTTAEDAAELLRIISENGEIERLKKHRDPIHFFHSSDAPARMTQMTFSDGSAVEKEAAMGERVLAYLYALADRYYRAAESAVDTPADTAMNGTTTTLPKQENP